jgi:hypothetical protein
LPAALGDSQRVNKLRPHPEERALARVSKDGRRRAALVYVAASRVRGRPRSGYMEVVMAAAREAALPPDYVRDLARHQRLTPKKLAPAKAGVADFSHQIMRQTKA